MDSTIEVRVLRTIPELEQFRPTWEAWPGHRDSDLDLFLSYLRSSPEVIRPHVVAIYRHGKPVVMLVGRMERVRLDFKIGYVHFRPTANILYFVYGGPRGDASSENCKLLISEIYKSLTREKADTAYLNFIELESDLHRFAKSIPNFLSRDHASVIQPHFSATLGETVEDFSRTLSSKVRKNQKWQARKLVNDFSGAVRINCFREKAEIDNLIQDVESIAKKSYQRGLGVGFSDSPAIRRYLESEAEKGLLRGNVLYVQDRPCAFWIGNINQTTFGSDYLGYDVEFGKYSPGIYLIMKVIEGFYGDGPNRVIEVDFAPGHAQYKEVLGNRKWEEASVYVFAPSIKGLGLNLLRSLTGTVDRFAKKVLIQTGLLQKIKKTWRTHARAKAQLSVSADRNRSEELQQTSI